MQVRKKETLEHLENMKSNYEKLINVFPNSGVHDNVIALDYAIKKVKKDKSYMSSYWQGAWHMFLLIFLVKVIDVLFNMFWA